MGIFVWAMKQVWCVLKLSLYRVVMLPLVGKTLAIDLPAIFKASMIGILLQIIMYKTLYLLNRISISGNIL